MEAKPPNVEPPKRKRRWFQFRLRTLMIAVTLLAIALAYAAPDVRIWHQRTAMLGPKHDGPLTLSNGVVVYEFRATLPSWRQEERISLLRRLLGDQPIYEIWLGYDTKSSDVARYEAAFPEADIHLGDPMDGDPYFHAFRLLRDPKEQ